MSNRQIKSETGSVSAEYGLVLVGVAAIVATAVALLGQRISALIGF